MIVYQSLSCQTLYNSFSCSLCFPCRNKFDFLIMKPEEHMSIGPACVCKENNILRAKAVITSIIRSWRCILCCTLSLKLLLKQSFSVASFTLGKTVQFCLLGRKHELPTLLTQKIRSFFISYSQKENFNFYKQELPCRSCCTITTKVKVSSATLFSIKKVKICPVCQRFRPSQYQKCLHCISGKMWSFYKTWVLLTGNHIIILTPQKKLFWKTGHRLLHDCLPNFFLPDTIQLMMSDSGMLYNSHQCK